MWLSSGFLFLNSTAPTNRCRNTLGRLPDIHRTANPTKSPTRGAPFFAAIDYALDETVDLSLTAGRHPLDHLSRTGRHDHLVGSTQAATSSAVNDAATSPDQT
jgi:hypothetical protein